MKILQLGKFYPIRGGVEKVMWNLTHGLSDRGILCDMLCACAGDDMPDGGVIRLNDHGRVICVRSWAKVSATMLSPAMICWLHRHCGEYDIIHIHHPDPMACLALRLSGFKGKVVLHWHSDILKQKTLLKFYKPLQSWLIRRADLILGTTPVYVAESPFLSDVQDKVAFLPIGIDSLLPQDDAVGDVCPDGTVTVFSLGRLVEYKGFGYLVDAARFLPENFHIVIAGDGPLKESLQSRIDASGLSDRVSLIGRISDEEKVRWLMKCDLFCLSSVWKTEAFAIVQIEAMSCGKPVVATRIPGSGVPWVNVDGVSGINVEVENAEALARAVLAVTSDRDRYKEYCLAAKKRFEDNFTSQEMIRRCISIYSSLQ